MPLWSGAQSLMSYKRYFTGPLKGWTQSFTPFHLEDFTLMPVAVPFEAIDPVQSKSLKDFYPVYKSALSFSPDGNYCLDIYGYLLLEKKGNQFYTPGSEVEQSILPGNIPLKKWLRVAYFGYSEQVQDIAWIDDHRFILAAALIDGSGKFQPRIMPGDLRKKTFQVFGSTKKNNNQKKEGYDAPKLKALAVKLIHH